jgi:single-stranded DNA-binding protein
MGSIATIQVLGNLTKDATCQPLQNSPGRLQVDFRIAANFYDKSAPNNKGSAFYGVRMFMSQERYNQINQFLCKGQSMLVYGEFKPRESRDNQGQTRTYLNIDRADFTVAGPVQSYNGGGGGATPPQGSGLPPGWKAMVDQASGQTYYVRPDGGTQWEPPPAPQPPQQQAGPPGAPPPGGPPQAGPPQAGPPQAGPPPSGPPQGAPPQGGYAQPGPATPPPPGGAAGGGGWGNGNNPL